ncbi:MAG: hypothetical protein FJ026_14105 [Chloroflexi bacterium]|nr:hypothetical protein [Chloroflexota bacterium]
MTIGVIGQILDALNREVLNGLDLATAINHPGESGRAREQIIAEFFHRLLPRSYSISTGFVIDATGAISRQVDLVIYRNDYHPVFEIGGIKHFLVESVAVAMENKASIGSTDALHRALENIKSVKALDRTNRGKNYTLIGPQKGVTCNPDDFQHQIFGAIVTEQSLSRETLARELGCFFRANPNRNHWPNVYADIRNLSAIYLKSVNPAAPTVVPGEAGYLGLTKSSSDDFVPPLIELAFEVLNFLRVAPQIDYSPTDYLLAGRGSGEVDWCRI